MFWHSSKETHGRRIWWHFGGDDGPRRCIGVELGWWHHFCHAGIECDDDGWNVSLGFPPLFFHLSIEGFPLWRPQYKTVATWRNPPEDIWLTDRRECRVAIHDWKIWISPWSRWGEWRSDDPWWVKGVTFDLKQLVLGRTRYTCEPLGRPVEVAISMPEGSYRAVFQRQRQTWKRPRWFAAVRESFDIDIPKGIPYAGKGENSWDCGDDGLFGMSAEGTIEQAVARVRDAVMESRRRYGQPSSESVAKARA